MIGESILELHDLVLYWTRNENQDQFLHLQNSYLLIEGEVLKADNARYADADLIALTNNGLWIYFPVRTSHCLETRCYI